MSITRILAAAALAVAVSVPARAHDIWLESDPAGVKVIYGHPGTLEAPDKSRVFELTAVSTAGRTLSLLDGYKTESPTLSAPVPLTTRSAQVVTARYDGGFWVKTPLGFRNTNKLTEPEAVESRWALKFAKLLLPGTDAQAYSRPVGHRLEIVPLADPFHLKAGEPLKVRVEYGGQPLPSAALVIGNGRTKPDTPVKVTADAAGIAVIPPQSGLTVLTTTHKVAGSVPQLAAEDALSAALTFTTPR